MTKHATIVEALVAVADGIGYVGKDSTNDGLKFRFRGIDALLNAVHPHLVEHGVAIIPKYHVHTYEVRPGREAGRVTTAAVVEGTFLFAIGAGQDQMLTVTTIGEAADSADKAVNKAMSAALKYALIQTFTIPTADQEDSDRHSPEYAGPAEEPAVASRRASWFALGQRLNATQRAQVMERVGPDGIDPILADELGFAAIVEYAESLMTEAPDVPVEDQIAARLVAAAGQKSKPARVKAVTNLGLDMAQAGVSDQTMTRFGVTLGVLKDRALNGEVTA